MRTHGSAPRGPPAARAPNPIFFMYEVPAAAPAAARAARGGSARPPPASAVAGGPGPTDYAEATSRTLRAPPASTCPPEGLKALWQRLHSVPRGAHGRLVRAAEEFAHAALAAQDAGFRRHALQSLVRELERQHAALATRLSRERRDCPHTTQLRDRVVCVKRRVRAAIVRARAPPDVLEPRGDGSAGHGRRSLPRAADTGTGSLCAGHAHDRADADDVLGLHQFKYVPGARRAGGVEGVNGAAASAAHAKACPLEGLRRLGYRCQPAGCNAPQVAQGTAGAGRAPEPRRASRRAGARKPPHTRSLVAASEHQGAKVTLSCFFAGTRARPHASPRSAEWRSREEKRGGGKAAVGSISSFPAACGKRSRFFAEAGSCGREEVT